MKTKMCPTSEEAYGPHSESGIFYSVFHRPRRMGDSPFHVCENHVGFYRNYGFEVKERKVRTAKVWPAKKRKDSNSFALEVHLTARYKHDACSNCKYLGRFKEYDLYYCQSIFTKTVLARYSSEPSEYLSGWGSYMLPLVVAEALAYRKNLVSEGKIG